MSSRESEGLVFQYVDHFHGPAGVLSLFGTMCVALIPRIVLEYHP
jgi:hypothetical protein